MCLPEDFVVGMGRCNRGMTNTLPYEAHLRNQPRGTGGIQQEEGGRNNRHTALLGSSKVDSKIIFFGKITQFATSVCL